MENFMNNLGAGCTAILAVCGTLLFSSFIIYLFLLMIRLIREEFFQ